MQMFFNDMSLIFWNCGSKSAKKVQTRANFHEVLTRSIAGDGSPIYLYTSMSHQHGWGSIDFPKIRFYGGKAWLRWAESIHPPICAAVVNNFFPVGNNIFLQNITTQGVHKKKIIPCTLLKTVNSKWNPYDIFHWQSFAFCYLPNFISPRIHSKYAPWWALNDSP